MTNAEQRGPTYSAGQITAAAHRNHEELFPNYQSTLKVTDPELIALFDNWAFDEVTRRGS